ncbi:MAG: 30S ribosomal protein S16 [Candidatus Vogelbacteria bacterium]|nr:30S ribosomal protein S16 [Candidatus Vogelbacteria bacterium]
MLMIRLQRVGRKNDPSFRVVVTDSKNGPQSGKFLEVLGSYNARFGKPQLNADRIKHWLAMGAGISDTVHNMLVKFKVVAGKTVNVLGQKPVKPEEPKVEEKAPEAPVVEKVEEVKVEEEVATETPVVEEAPVEAPVETTPEPEVVAETPAEEKTA